MQNDSGITARWIPESIFIEEARGLIEVPEWLRDLVFDEKFSLPTMVANFDEVPPYESSRCHNGVSAG